MWIWSSLRGRSRHAAGFVLAFAVVFVCAALAAPRAFAQPDPVFTMGKADDVKDVKDVQWIAKGEAGLVASTGNSRVTSITAGANVIRKDKDNKLEASVGGTYARATTRLVIDANDNGVIDPGELSNVTATSAENGAAKLRYDRYFSDLDSLYVAGLAAFDHPAGKEFQGGGQAGYSRSLYKSPEHQALVELGYDLSYLHLLNGDSTTIHSLRGFVGYKTKPTKETVIEASGEGLFNANAVTFGDRSARAFHDARLNGTVSVTTSLSTKLSFSASFTAKYDSFPAPLAKIGDLPFATGFEPIADKLDTVTKLALIIKFL